MELRPHLCCKPGSQGPQSSRKIRLGFTNPRGAWKVVPAESPPVAFGRRRAKRKPWGGSCSTQGESRVNSESCDMGRKRGRGCDNGLLALTQTASSWSFPFPPGWGRGRRQGRRRQLLSRRVFLLHGVPRAPAAAMAKVEWLLAPWHREGKAGGQRCFQGFGVPGRGTGTWRLSSSEAMR